ncbi:LOW QUALITY PROTEIN: sterile alpha motif domain-containing protein 1-like, partial [Pipistrellus kuhlii]|uniref:LOW QUALITY PROTEIN: sterile alpha motif domain-containing protein 1-like n=1 Tax=Pipistrellus kuhlii TaxID=59472 RepID=UPI001E2734A8
ESAGESLPAATSLPPDTHPRSAGCARDGPRPPDFSAPAAPGAPVARAEPLPGGPGAPRTAAAPLPPRATAWAARTLDRASRPAATRDPSPEPPPPPRPKPAPPTRTHRSAPSRVPDADAGPTLTAVAAAAAGWSSQPPSPTTRGHSAKPPPPQPPPPPPRCPPPPRPRPRSSRPFPPPEPSPLAPARRGGAWRAAAGGAVSGSGTQGDWLSIAREPADCPRRRRCWPVCAVCHRTSEANLRNKSPFAPSSRQQVFCPGW